MRLMCVATTLLLLLILPLASAQDRNCSDYNSQAEAQQFFESMCGPQNDPNELDADSDGIACEEYFESESPVSVRLEIYVVSKVGGEEKFQEASTARPGQVVEYRLFATNEGDTTLPPGTVVVSGPVPEGTTFVANSATPTSDRVLTEFSVDGETFGDGDAPLIIAAPNGTRRPAAPDDYSVVRWTLLSPLEPGQEEPFIYRVTVNSD